jgi:hypothetical protein
VYNSIVISIICKEKQIMLILRIKMLQQLSSTTTFSSLLLFAMHTSDEGLFWLSASAITQRANKNHVFLSLSLLVEFV